MVYLLGGLFWFGLLFGFFFYFIFFFPTGESDRCHRETQSAGIASTSALHPGHGARPSQSCPPSRGENEISSSPKGNAGIWGVPLHALGRWGVAMKVKAPGEPPPISGSWSEREQPQPCAKTSPFRASLPKNPGIGLKVALGYG